MIRSTPAEVGAPLSRRKRARLGDFIASKATGIAALALVALLVAFLINFALGSREGLRVLGFRYLWTTGIIAKFSVQGAFPYIFGTLVTSAIALILGVPVAVGLALFVTEVCPRRIRAAVATLSDMLAAIPSVVYGMWGFFVLTPWMDATLEPWLHKVLGPIPGFGRLFQGNTFGSDILTAGVILSIMILPIVTSISREILSAVPRELRDGAYALGATRYEVIRGVTLPFSRAGIVGASMLGLGRALGETIAVIMVIGNNASVQASLFGKGYTIPSFIAGSFGESGTNGLDRSLLTLMALILVVISLGFAALARLFVRRINQRARIAFDTGSARSAWMSRSR
ncbi:MAG TPA: phosphate ABC transporter permease subunit PstC [Actinomycetota bacterium]|nr:phosphate ABC transporter permease subunit PstC [Actinomycetota bacterium]